MKKAMNYNRFASRFTALFVMLAIIIQMITVPAWADTTGQLNGSIELAENIIQTGEKNETRLSYSLGTAGEETFEPRLYMTSEDGNVSTMIKIGELLSWEEGSSFGNVYAQYTLHKDEAGRYYFLISDFNSGETLNTFLTVNFVKGVKDGTEVTFKMCNGSYDNPITGNGGSYEATLTAQANAEWHSYKSTDVTSITINTGAVTLSNNIANTSKITYTMKESSNADGTTGINDGGSIIRSYTAYDTVTLPAGTYISAGDNAEAAIRAAYSISNTAYEIKDIQYDSNNNITGFTAYWTVTNTNPTSQLAAAEYTAELDLTKINVNTGFSSADIKNELETTYKWDTKQGEKSDTTTPTVATTTVVPDGSAIAGVTKEVKSIVDGITGNKRDIWWIGEAISVKNGDKILYEINITNGSDNEQTYTVSDILTAYGLKNIKKSEVTQWNSDYNNETEITGKDDSITIPARGSKKLYICAEVEQDLDGSLTNTVEVTSGNEKMEASVTVTQEKLNPELTISKTIGGLSAGDIYKAGEGFYYDITVKNTGTKAAEKIELSDALPDGLIYQSLENGNGSVTYDSTSNKISGTITSLEPNSEVKVRVNVKVVDENAPSSITNTAEAVMYDADNAELDRKSASVTVALNRASVANLTISKSTDKAVVQKGDTVVYTVTVTNPKWCGPLENAAFNVTDIIPNGLEYVSNTSGGDVTKNENGEVTITFENKTLSAGEAITFTVTCKVVGDADSQYANEAYISDTEGNRGNSDTDNSITPDGTSSSSSILVEKDALVNGESINGKTVPANTEITYTVKITNKGETPLSDFTLSDVMSGSYAGLYGGYKNIALTIAEIGTGVTWFNNNGETVTAGTSYNIQGVQNTFGVSSKWNITDYGNGYIYYGGNYTDGTTFYINGLRLPKDGYIVLSYTVTTASDFTGGSNTAILKSGNDTSISKVTYDFGEAPEQTDEPVASNAQLEITKEAIKQKSYTVSDDTNTVKSDLEGYRFGYTVTVKNKSDEDYTTNNAVFTDKIPAGFALSINYKDSWGWPNHDSTTVIVKNGESCYKTSDFVSEHLGDVTVKLDDKNICSNPWQTLKDLGFVDNNGNVQGGYYKISGEKLKVSFPNSLTIKARQSLTFTYYLTPSDDEIASIMNEVEANNEALFDDRAYKNEAAFSAGTSFKDKDGNDVKEVKAVETVHIYSPKIHPGIEKTPLYAIGNADTELKAFSETIPQLEDTFVWSVTVYNTTDITGKGKTLKNYTVTEAYPDLYKYKGESYSNTKGISYEAVCTKYTAAGAATTLTYVKPNENGEFTFNGDDYALAAGEKLVFTVITEPIESGVMGYGLYTNTVTLKTGDQEFDKDNVCAGEVNADGNAITASSSIPLYLIYTTSTKSVTVGEKTASSDGSASSNTIGASMGDTVTYKLSVTNHDTQKYLEDFTIIDRLPYSGDSYVIANAERGSVFPIKYAGKAKAVVTLKDKTEIDITNHLMTSFASGSSEHFTALDTDWDTRVRAASTKVAWGNSQSESTNLVRFGFDLAAAGDSFKVDNNGTYGIPPESTVTITFEGKIPDYVMNSGENHVAWNSFGYYFNSGSYENMIAEPSKVGVWVEDSSTGGSILVKKFYYTNRPSLKRTFYFALYAGEYNETSNNTPIEVKSLEMTGSEAGAQATTYFTDITYETDGTAFYVYESDKNGKPLTATDTTTATYTSSKPMNGSTTTETEKTYSNEIATKTVTGADGYSFTMDNSSQLEAAQGKPTWEQYEKEVQGYNSNYLVWHKDLSASCTTNSAIFTNEYYAGIESQIMGPFYADVPTDKSVASSDMTSTRPNQFNEGVISDTVKSDERVENFAPGTTYDATSDTTAYGGKYKHTIATGFLAKIKSEGEYTLEQITWNITTSNPSATSDNPGVYVKLKTNTVQDNGEQAQLMYLNDFEMFEESDDGNAELFEVGGFDDVSDDETFMSSYTVEERAAIIAESLGLDPESVRYDDYGCPYVVIDEAVENEAFALSEGTVTAQSGAVTTQDSFTGSELNSSVFANDNDTEGYAIFKLGGTKQYSMTITDNLPHITLAEGAEAYVGIIIDRLYDQKATATLECSDKQTYSDEMLEDAMKASEDEYVGVKSPFQKGDFSVGTLMKLTSGKTYGFTGFEEGDHVSDISNANNTMKLTAASGKKITVHTGNGNTEYGNWSGITYLKLNGSGRNDYRSIVVNVNAGTAIEVHARSAANKERTLIIEDSQGNKQELTVPAKDAENTAIAEKWSKAITIGAGGPVYIYSKGSGIDVFEIVVK